MIQRGRSSSGAFNCVVEQTTAIRISKKKNEAMLSKCCVYICVWKGIITVIWSWARAFWKSETKVDLCQLECGVYESGRGEGIMKTQKQKGQGSWDGLRERSGRGAL